MLEIGFPTTINRSAAGYQAPPAKSIWQIRSTRGETIWRWIAWTFAAYWALFIAGAFLGHKQLNAIGGVMLLCVLALAALERLWVRLDAVVIASTAAAVIPLFYLLSSPTPGAIEAYIKYSSVLAVMALSRMLQLPEVSGSKMRWFFAAQVLAVLLLSMTVHRGTAWDGGSRHSGLFPNPNNLALIPFLLLFLVDHVKGRPIIRICVHAIVVAVLVFTGTSGAIIAYTIGLFVHVRSALAPAWRFAIYLAASCAVLAGIALVGFGADQLLPQTRLTNQISFVSSELRNVLQGENIEFYRKESAMGSGSGSAIWRIEHWRDTLEEYGRGTAVEQIIGFGPGSSVAKLDILPHNEYLRVLFEAGIVGLALFVFAWYRIIKTAPPSVRYVGLIFAIYSFSENNLDNFPFMALMTLFLSATVIAGRVGTVRREIQ